ncbi:hypothetical protein ASF99_01835 [Exiguobacterium sp. Leaf187]|uniref:hypothetical protein n=1 Tax=Exiguobacterium sp. Leaf187 TaxID=1736294 RepID=UPI0006FB894D|nr:hypothetical protein [Exiguobacterium sp. Leaf187]KQS18655.1 hypothetical protein ASF99_01835 [Exiguobacterium sp. Leaf187]
MQIYIEEHQNHAKTIKEYHLTLKGQDRIESIFSFEYYNDDSKEDEVISDEEVLTQLFTRLNRFPIYLSFGFHELTDLEKEDLLSTLKHKQLSYTEISITKRERYMTVEVNHPTDLFQVLTQSITMANYNGYYLIAFTNLLKFERQRVRRWFINKERVVPVIDMTKPTTFFKIGFDFENVLIFSNETDFDALEKIEALFPDDEIER